MNALIIMPENLPETPEKLVNMVHIGNEKIKKFNAGIKLISGIEEKKEEYKKLLKIGQETGIKLLQIQSKLGELSFQNSIDKRDLQGPDGKFKKGKFEEKWKRMGFDNQHQLKDAQKVYKNPELVKEIIEDAIENDYIPCIFHVRKSIYHTKEKYRRKEKIKISDKEEIIFDLGKINKKIMNMDLKKDEYFLKTSKEIIENMLKNINNIQMMNDLKENGLCIQEKKFIKKLI